MPKAEEQLWIYELRNAQRYSLKTRPLERTDLAEFEAMYPSGKREAHSGSISELLSSTSRTYSVADILKTEECFLDMAVADMSPERQPGLTRLDDLTRLVEADLRRALELISSMKA